MLFKAKTKYYIKIGFGIGYFIKKTISKNLHMQIILILFLTI